jgi:hypothetical protein
MHTNHAEFSVEEPPEQLPPRGRGQAQRGNFYPRLAPNRPVYVAARSLAVVISIALIILAVIALTALPDGRDRLAAPILSPAISTLFGSGLEVWRIYKYNRRSHHAYRICYDAALGIGYAIAFGFLAAFTRGDIARTDPMSTSTSAAVSVAILLMMLTEL